MSSFSLSQFLNKDKDEDGKEFSTSLPTKKETEKGKQKAAEKVASSNGPVRPISKKMESSGGQSPKSPKDGKLKALINNLSSRLVDDRQPTQTTKPEDIGTSKDSAAESAVKKGKGVTNPAGKNQKTVEQAAPETTNTDNSGEQVYETGVEEDDDTKDSKADEEIAKDNNPETQPAPVKAAPVANKSRKNSPVKTRSPAKSRSPSRRRGSASPKDNSPPPSPAPKGSLFEPISQRISSGGGTGEPAKPTPKAKPKSKPKSRSASRSRSASAAKRGRSRSTKSERTAKKTKKGEKLDTIEE